MSKYDDFDARMLDLIQWGKNKFVLLELDPTLQTLAEPHRIKDGYGNLKPIFRVIDGRLQAMKKAGKIRFHGGVWELR